MRQPYENIYLGNFILTLGYIAGLRGLKLNQTALQLLQQTPDDRTVGDLFANWGGRNFIFEFKRTEPLVKSEFSKPQRAKLLSTILRPESQQLLDLSGRCHYMCFPVRSTNSTLSFVPYALIQNSTSQDQIDRIDLSRFCKSLLQGSPHLGASYKHFSDYLAFLARFTDGDPTGSGGAGAIMNISEEGEINIVEVDNLRILARKLDHGPELPPKTRTVSPGSCF